MNYIAILFIIAVVGYLLSHPSFIDGVTKVGMNSKPLRVQNARNANVKNSRNANVKHARNSQISSLGNMGFVKPEHKLKQIFTLLSSGDKISLTGSCEEFIYDKNTMPVWLQENAVSLVNLIVTSLTRLSQREYFMKGIENVYILQDKKKNVRYLMDFFVYDVVNYYTMRLLCDIVVVDGIVYVNYMNIQEASMPILMNRFDVRFETGSILLPKNMFSETLRSLFDDYYTKSFKVRGVSDSHLEYSRENLDGVINLSSVVKGYVPSHVSHETMDDLGVKGLDGYLEMYLPHNQQTIKDPLFCKKYAMNWDSHGIPDELSHDSACVFHNSGSQDMITQPYDAPGVVTGRESSEYPWLYDREQIISAL